MLTSCSAPSGGTGEGPALWRVQSPTATVYLLGTKHILGAPAPWFTPRIAAAFAESGELLLELAPGGEQAGIRYAAARGFDKAFDLPSRLPEGLWPKLHPVLVACGIPEAMVAHTRPWFVSLTITSCATRLRTGPAASTTPNLALLPDLMLANLATSQGKPVGGLESWEQQFAALADLPDATMLFMFHAQGTTSPARPPTTDPLVGASLDTPWLHGDLAALGAAVVTPLRASQPAYYSSVLGQRNVGFADAIAAILAQRTTAFVAIGTGHLIGPDSVLALLSGRYRIERME